MSSKKETLSRQRLSENQFLKKNQKKHLHFSPTYDTIYNVERTRKAFISGRPLVLTTKVTNSNHPYRKDMINYD